MPAKGTPCRRCGLPLVGTHPITLHPTGSTFCADGVDGRYCLVHDGRAHSDDLVPVFRGRALPDIICGKHASTLT